MRMGPQISSSEASFTTGQLPGSSPDQTAALSKSSMRPRNNTVPSYRPIQKQGVRKVPAQLVTGSGEEQNPVQHFQRYGLYKERGGAPIKTTGYRLYLQNLLFVVIARSVSFQAG